MSASAREFRAEYEARMLRVLEHIDAHLAEPLELNELAGVAHFSPFHFHRLFRAWMGETLGDFVRRRRLERAAVRLLAQPQLGVLEVALAVGFGSVEAFSRAFKARFGASPTAWRALDPAERGDRNADQFDRNPDQVLRKAGHASSPPSSHDRVSDAPLKETSMKVQLIDRRPTPVAYLRYTGPFGEPVSSFWQDTVYPWMVTNRLLGRARYGISQDDPGITSSDKCRYDAAVEAAADEVLTGRALRATLPGGRYAALSFKGTTFDIQSAWTALLRDWVPQSGLQLDDRPCFEYYPTDAAWDEKTGAFTCQLCIPVKPL